MIRTITLLRPNALERHVAVNTSSADLPGRASNSAHLLISFCVLLFLSSCASVSKQATIQPPELQTCEQWLHEWNRLIVKNNVRDNQATIVSDIPWLRTNRFLSSYAWSELTATQKNDWVEQAYTVGRSGFFSELSNLSSLSKPIDLTQVTACITQEKERLAAEQWQPLDSADFAVPDSYKTVNRWLGVYPISSRLASSSIDEYRRTMIETMTKKDVQFPSLFYGFSAARSETTVPVETKNSLNIPLHSEDEWQQLFSRFAPEIAVEQVSFDDRIGQLSWQESTLSVDIARPTLYTFTSYTRWQGEVLRQLNYGFWFPARTAESGFDIYAGPIDGILWRVTLDAEGEPVWYDSIHQCGCYHKIFLPDDRLVLNPDLTDEAPIVITLPDGATQQPVRLNIRAKDHYILSVEPATPINLPVQRYRIADYQSLLQLNKGDGTQSAFGKRGIMKQSQRLERFTLWPLGVENAGAMRQNGQHAIAFIGRRHFDDAFIFESLLAEKPAE